MRELYVLDEDYQDVAVIDSYNSLIWTERFDEFGDFELHIPSNRDLRELLRKGTVLSIENSYRMMVVESIEEGPSESGWSLTFKGRSLEKVLSDRVGRTTPSGSPKTWINRLADQALRAGLYSPDDKLDGIEHGLGKIYMPSTIAPNANPAPYTGSGWTGLQEAYDSAKTLSGLGFRILRKPHTTQLYYETYTGNDLTNEATYKLDESRILFPNPYMFETDDDIEVWRNHAFNPGFDSGILPLSPDSEPYVTRNKTTPTEVDVSWSRSGKGLLIPSPSDRENNYTTMRLTTNKDGENLSTIWSDGRTLAGRKFTLSVKIEIKSAQGGTPAPVARSLRVVARKPGGNDVELAIDQAPNTVGVHQLSVSFIVPNVGNPSGYNEWRVYLANGNGLTDNGVIFGDLCFFEASSNPIGYFDGSYSPDGDLLPVWKEWENKHGITMYNGILTGRRVQGTEFYNCAFIQSREWDGGQGGLSGRLIKNEDNFFAPYVWFNMTGQATRFRTTVYQKEVLTPATSNFGSVSLYNGSVWLTTGAEKPNVPGERRHSLYHATGFTRARVNGNFRDFGGSMWVGTTFIATTQTTNIETVTPVIFSEELDNFVADRSLSSDEDYKNVAYVTRGSLMMEIDDGYAKPGLERRVVHVDADNLEDTPSMRTEMMAMGTKELASRRRVFLIDGEIPPYSRYKYDVDYGLGDIVRIVNRSGESVFARVVEQIFIADEEGVRTYPTLREEYSVTSGHWYAPQYHVRWIDAEPLGAWADQP